MSITLSASRQWKLLRCRGAPKFLTPLAHPSLYRHSSTECDSLSSADDESSIVNQVVELLQGPEKDWNNDKLHPLLFSGSTARPRRLLEITLRLGSSSEALNFLEYFKANVPYEQHPSLSFAFQGVFELASREPDSKVKLLELYKTSKEHKVPFTTKSAALLMHNFERAGMVDESLNLFKELDPSRRSTRICNKVIVALLRVGRSNDAFQVLEEMLTPNAKFSPDDFTGRIIFTELLKKRLERSVAEEEIVDLVRRLGELGVFPDTFQLTQLIAKLCGKRKTGLACDLLCDVIKLGGAVEAPSFNALLSGLGRDRDIKRMNDLLAKMKETEINPDVITFGILINHLCKSRRIDEALIVLEKMKGQGESHVEPDVIIFNTLIDGLCKVGRQEDGLNMLEQMKMQNGLKPTAATYNCLIDGFCKVGEIDKAYELYDQMNKEGILPNVVTLNAMLDGMCRNGRINSAARFLEEMQEKGLKGNAVTYTVLISAFCNVNNIDKALKYFNEMLSSKCSPDAIVYYSLISGLSLAGRMDDASSVVSKLKDAGFGLDVTCYNMLISGFCKKNKLDRVHELLKEMEQTGVKPDTVTYNTIVSYLAKSGDFATASQVMMKMIDEGLVPTVVTYGSLIHAYCVNDNIDEAMKIFREMKSSTKIPPNTVIYNILIDSLCKNNDVEQAVSLMDDMKVRGIRPNTTTYNAIFKGVRDKNMLHKAFELMDRMVEDACSPDYITMEVLTEWLSAVGQIEKLKMFVQGYEVSSCTASSG